MRDLLGYFRGSTTAKNFKCFNFARFKTYLCLAVNFFQQFSFYFLLDRIFFV